MSKPVRLTIKKLIIAIAVLGVILPTFASAQGAPEPLEFRSQRHLQKWINGYRENPEPDRVPGAVRAMYEFGLFENQEKAGTYIGFLAGAIGFNQIKAKTLVEQMFPMPPKEQAIIIKAIAYSGLPEWQDLMRDMAERMPARKKMIYEYLSSTRKTLLEVPLESDPIIIDVLWGYYIATGYFEPVVRIIHALPWTRDTTNIEKITAGHMAKWTLAANAERDRGLLEIYRAELAIKSHPKDLRKPLKQVIKASENFEADQLRKEAVEIITVEKRKSPYQRSKWALANQVGSTLLAIGCVTAGALGHVEIAAPCVITGVVSSGAVKLLTMKN